MEDTGSILQCPLVLLRGVELVRGSNLAAEAARLQAIDLPVGSTSKNILCPVCDGGTHHDPTFAVSRQSTRIAYICYRASCGVGGYVDDCGNSQFDPTLPPAKKPMKPYKGSINLLTQEDKTYFRERFGIPKGYSDAMIRHTGFGSYLIPVWNWERRIVGHVIRDPVWKGKPTAPRSNPGWDGPKAVVKMKEDSPSICFYWSHGKLTDWILVEDQISAIKLSAFGYNAVALLGTQLNLDKVRDIQRAGGRRITIALDEDATATAFTLAREYGLAFDKTKVVIMPQDVKDTDSEEFYSLFGDY